MERTIAEFYEHHYAALYRHTVAEVPRQIAFLEQHAGLRPGCMVLDIGCGWGRHAVPLAAMGCTVVGLDCSIALLRQALSRATAPLLLVGADMRWLPLVRRHMFDLVLLLFGTLGHVEPDEQLDVLRECGARLKPAGCLVVDALSALWHQRWARPETVWTPPAAPHLTVRDILRTRPGEGRVVVERHVRNGRRRACYLLAQTLHTPSSLRQLLVDAGFSSIAMHGDWGESPPGRAQYIIAVAGK